MFPLVQSSACSLINYFQRLVLQVLLISSPPPPLLWFSLRLSSSGINSSSIFFFVITSHQWVSLQDRDVFIQNWSFTNKLTDTSVLIALLPAARDGPSSSSCFVVWYPLPGLFQSTLKSWLYFYVQVF